MYNNVDVVNSKKKLGVKIHAEMLNVGLRGPTFSYARFRLAMECTRQRLNMCDGFTSVVLRSNSNTRSLNESFHSVCAIDLARHTL